MKQVKSASICISMVIVFTLGCHAQMQSIQPGSEEKQLQVFVGKWITEGETVASASTSSVKVVASDIYEWASSGFFILHKAYGVAGNMKGGSIEMIGYNKESKKYASYFFDANGIMHKSDLTYKDGIWMWEGKMGSLWVRCKGTFSNDGKVLTANHEQSADGINWAPSINVKLTKVE